jgi:hypothetical protein
MTNEMNEARIGTARSLACVQLTFLISCQVTYIQLTIQTISSIYNLDMTRSTGNIRDSLLRIPHKLYSRTFTPLPIPYSHDQDAPHRSHQQSKSSLSHLRILPTEDRSGFSEPTRSYTKTSGETITGPNRCIRNMGCGGSDRREKSGAGRTCCQDGLGGYIAFDMYEHAKSTCG